MSKKELDALEQAVDMLSKDHDEVDGMFDDYKKLMDYEAARARGALDDRRAIEKRENPPIGRQIRAAIGGSFRIGYATLFEYP